jgi:hypothetical protein
VGWVSAFAKASADKSFRLRSDFILACQPSLKLRLAGQQEL